VSNVENGIEALTDGGKVRAMQPEDLNRLFEERTNAGDVEGLVALYKPNATLAFPPGQITNGSEAIRQVFEQVLAGKPSLAAIQRPTVRMGDLALTSVTWSMTMAGPDGQPTAIDGTSAEVVRRQPDGTWLRVIDQPSAVE